jgi:hypothetical protein
MDSRTTLRSMNMSDTTTKAVPHHPGTPGDGFLYIATGDIYLREAVRSIKTLRSCMPGAHVTICTDGAPPTGVFDLVLPISTPTRGFRDKIINIVRTPYQRTIYVDTDIYFWSSVGELFELLDRVELFVSFEACRGYWYHARKYVPEGFPELSTGFIGFQSSPRVLNTFGKWLELHHRIADWNGINGGDQTSFRRLLYESDLRFSVLPEEFHCIPANFTHVIGEVRCVHNRDWQKAAAIAYDFNTTALWSPRAFIELLGIVANPWGMSIRMLITTWFRFTRHLPLLVARRAYIEFKSRVKWNRLLTGVKGSVKITWGGQTGKNSAT